MTTTQEMVLIGLIVKDLADNGSWCGETHIQKTAYIDIQSSQTTKSTGIIGCNKNYLKY